MNTPGYYPTSPKAIPVDDEQISTAPQAVPVPYVAGTRKIALRWISRTYNQRAVEATQDRPEKK
jgi:hypothetical protein